MTKRAKSLSKGKSKTSRARATKTVRAKIKRKPPVYDPLGDFVDAAAHALDLRVEPAWKGAVKTNLAVTLRLATLFADFPLPDDAEPAPVFVASRFCTPMGVKDSDAPRARWLTSPPLAVSSSVAERTVQ